MKILHTADWHLGDRLGQRIDRTEDLRRAVEQIAEYCQQEEVDVLLVAGDLFSEMVRPDSWREHIEHLEQTFRPFLLRGGTIVALTGNHDNEHLCGTIVEAMGLVEPAEVTPSAATPSRSGRFYLATRPTLLCLADRRNTRVQFVLMPYPRPTHFAPDFFVPRSGTTPQERANMLSSCWVRTLEKICSAPGFDPTIPAVLAGHIQLYGADISHGLFRIHPPDDVVIPRAQWVEWFDYIALGHIHKPQVLNGQPHIRYSGSIECLDLGEKDDRKGVVIVEVGGQGLSAEPRFLPLPATPIEEIHIRDSESDLPRLEQLYPPEWRQRALVKLVIHYQAGHDILDDILEKAAQLFPRWYERDWREVNALGQPWPLEEYEACHHQSVAQVVREYVEHNLADQPEEERQALLQMVEKVLQECGEIPTGATVTSSGIPSLSSCPGAAAMESEDEADAGGFLWEESEGE
ncbi:metallophosphoesterase family protein [Thermogemmata fonticola]|uniref:Exonuclease SbcCD subunit D n=1 Tax=Thermogemmata fonticola TaxID=2755323 RepID=A0A7V9ACK5_9BACT|nr:exonuclease SbcCD subunit D [Thermogemmata fonticola]MBA2227268.1 exonuclease SbcCD subunit D [Thermogemmata fonticola]